MGGGGTFDIMSPPWKFVRGDVSPSLPPPSPPLTPMTYCMEGWFYYFVHTPMPGMMGFCFLLQLIQSLVTKVSKEFHYVFKSMDMPCANTYWVISFTCSFKCAISALSWNKSPETICPGGQSYLWHGWTDTLILNRIMRPAFVRCTKYYKNPK